MFESLKKLTNILNAVLPDAAFFLIGGAVRDALLNNDFNHPSIKDMDVECYYVKPDALESLFTRLNIKFDKVGESFGVYKIYWEGHTFDFSFPRREEKTGQGYKGFSVQLDPNMTTVQASRRRDFTINAIMYNLQEGALNPFIDHFDGLRDLKERMLCAVDSSTFIEDPLRVLRAFQFISRFNLNYESNLIRLCKKLLPEKNTLTPERVWVEWEKWCTKSKSPSKGLNFLFMCDWLEDEIKSLHGVLQDPVWHPEGDAFQHTLHVVDAANEIRLRESLDKDESIILMLSALCHDMGKAVSTTLSNGRWVSPGHAESGVPIAAKFLEKINCPLKYRKAILILVKEHMSHLVNEVTPKMVRRLINRLVDGETNLRMLGMLVEADHSGRPPLEKGIPQKLTDILKISIEIGVDGESKIAPEITGDDLIALGFKEGKELGDVLKELYNRQLDGENVRAKYLGIFVGDL